ncbi:MAG TPA: AI-2E family transporter [Solirubrobacteraceae bacterium]|jgi:predicted PurR-regulated permease PerM|nr:AI-2E family transporter [Solirubrobacteraceae bacterium]
MTDPSGSAPPAAPPDPEERALTDSPRAQADEPPRVVVPRWVQLVALPLSVLAAWALAKAAGKVLLLFIIAGLIALILNPAVSFAQRGRIPRGLAVLLVYLAFFVGLAGIGVLLANPISNQVRTFTNNLPSIVNEANKKLGEAQRELNNAGVHVELVKPGKTALQSIQAKVAKSASKFVSFGGALLTEVANAIFNLVLIFVLSVYMLLYGQQIGALVRRVMPPGDGSQADDYPTLVQRAVSRYVGGQLLFSAIMGTSAGVALYIFGITGIFPDGSKYALAFGVFYGVMELVPYIGPILGAAPPVAVALFTNPITALWVVLLFVGLQQLEGHVVAPQVFGHTLRINPLLVIFALLTGLEVDGIFGALVALPILSVVRETVVYLSRHLTFEPWSDTSRRLL